MCEDGAMESRSYLLLCGGRVIDPASGRDGIANSGITDGRIAAIEPVISGEAAHQVRAPSDRMTIPGFRHFVDAKATIAPYAPNDRR